MEASFINTSFKDILMMCSEVTAIEALVFFTIE